MVKDINPGTSSSIINYSFRDLGGKLVFAASNSTYGEEIWISDGTNTGTILLNDINPGVANSFVPNSPINFVIGSNYYFTANTTSLGNELWKSDGTVAGTVLVKDINAGAGSSYVDGSDYSNAISGTSIIFNAAEENGNELWISDGTEAGTLLIQDIFPGTSYDIDDNSFPSSSDPNNLVSIDGTIYFAARTNLGTELWRSDGTVAGTYLIKDINCCNTESAYPANFYMHDDLTFFSATNGVNGTEAFVTDGTTAGTLMLQDAHPSNYDYDFDNVEMEFAEFGGYIYYTNNHGQLCKTDGSPAGSSVIFNTGEDKSYSIRSNGTIIYFLTAMHGPVGDTVKLWKSDGTALGTIKLKTLTLNPSAEYATEFLGFTGGYLLFAAQKTATSNYELFKSDGTPEGTILLKEIQNASSGSYPSNGFEYDGDVFFTAASSTYGNELWRSNGTGGGTQMVKDMRVGSQDSDPGNLIEMGGLLYFTAEQDGSYDRGLWVSDGTTAGTYRIKDLDIPEPDPDDDHSPVLIQMDGKLYFRILDELWQSDGTELGTYFVYSIPLGIPENKVVFNHVIYFTADEALYRFDGICGNKKLIDLNDLDYNFTEYTLFATNEHLYIILSTPTYGYELWQFTDDQLMPVKCIPDNDDYCQGELFDVDYEFICTSSPNTFNVEISNSTGSFDSPTIIGTSGSYSYSGTIYYCEIPTDVPSGTGYRMRITSTNTAQISPDNGFDITVLESPAANVNTPNGHDLCGYDSLLLKTSGAPGYSYKWIKNDYFIAGAISKLYYAKEPGNYAVRITDPAGCYTISEDKHINETCRELADDFAKTDILIAPNPNSGAFTITIDQINENSKIEIFNSVGHLIYSEDLNSSTQTISLNNISSGIYFVRVGDGNNYAEQKLIIEK
jgi:ELWxxDGT repeat protein